VDKRWLWKGRRVYVYDGPHASMPDTAANQAEYPQPDTQKPGLGFPLARLGAVFSLACGALVELGICRYAGKGQSELGMLRTLWDIFRPGDVLLADRLMCAWTEMVMLKRRGVDCVCRLNSHRSADFRRGQRLGAGDHVVVWPKPPRPRSIDRDTYDALPDALAVRECRVRVGQPGFRVRILIVATTLLDAKEFPRDDLAQLYRARWNAEKDQADCPSSGGWVGTRRIGYHRRDGAARAGRVVPAAPGRPHRRSRMPDTTRRRPTPPRARR
jgi:hypothetical protein